MCAKHIAPIIAFRTEAACIRLNDKLWRTDDDIRIHLVYTIAVADLPLLTLRRRRTI